MIFKTVFRQFKRRPVASLLAVCQFTLSLYFISLAVFNISGYFTVTRIYKNCCGENSFYVNNDANLGRILLEEYGLNKPHAHNFIIETWMNLGIIGMLLLAVVLVCNFGKLLEINANSGKKFTLVFCVLTATITYLLYGLTDYIFNSPKQIILLFILLGLTQAISFCYDKNIIKDPETLIHVAETDIKNMINQ